MDILKPEFRTRAVWGREKAKERDHLYNEYMNYLNPNLIMERTWEQKKADEHEKAKEHERLDGEYQVLARETADLRSFLTHINRLLDDPDNDASQLEIQQDIKVTHERMISRNEDLMAEKIRFMKWLRKPGKWHSPNKRCRVECGEGVLSG